MKLRRLEGPPDAAIWQDVLMLLRHAFAYMEPLQGFPPRVIALTPADIAARAAGGAAWGVFSGQQVVACLFTRASRDVPDALFLSMLATDQSVRGQGLAGRLLAAAEAHARGLGISTITLDTGSALTDLRRRYRAWGFTEIMDDGNDVRFIKELR